ncbi:hypothetical protein BYT27DRAFT_7228955 [Phlegmacium glaucopus]|nr:hypothetical protein BYT27DRAFT_7228955 [Phlegmacium glaucopus]
MTFCLMVLSPLVPISEETSVANFTDDLRPTTDGIFEICPRFRVLVIGRTGAGKTSLIKNTFGIQEAHISHGAVGECDINQELFSDVENKRFVLHDSKGFEPGDEDNFATVVKFLNERKEKPDIKDQVHAVWLCFMIPVAGDRLFETGAEEFLRSLSAGRLGKMPIIAIFTKYDKLVDDVMFNSGTFAEHDENVEAAARARLAELCIKPFKDHIREKTHIPGIPVSSEYLSEDVAVLSAVAQQVNPTVKLDAVIANGSYWKIFATAVNFPGNQPEIVLQNIHQDIISIFNLQDPEKLLDSKIFKGMVARIVTQEDVLSLKQMATSMSMLGALAALVTALSGPVAPIVLPIAATLVVGHWTVLLIKQANIVLKGLMTYIVALTLVMQIIFAITTSTKNIVSRRLIKAAVKTFLDSSQLERIKYAITQHSQRSMVVPGRDSVLQSITELIESNRMSSDDMAKIKAMMRDFDIRYDEPW